MDSATCSESDIDLLTSLYSWWELTDNVSAIDLADQGIVNFDMVDNSSGLPPAYVHDTDRGDPPGAAVFLQGDGTGLKAVDAPGFYIPTDDNSFTIGIWVKLGVNAVDGNILTYHTGTTVRYRLRYMVAADRFVFSVVGASGTLNVTANSLGSPTIGTWYWIELSYDYTSGIAGIRVAPARTPAGQPLVVEHETGVVPGGLVRNAGALSLGYYGSGTNFAFEGRAAAVGFWGGLLNDCERGRLNVPSDYPFPAPVAAGFESEGSDSFAAEDGSTTFDPE